MVSGAEAKDYIFGNACVNDVTAVDLLKKTPTFDQWVRAKSFDTFGVLGPTIATGLDPMSLRVRTVLNGKEVQNYPVADMFFPPYKLVAALSRDMTLMPGDVIACGTSLGAGPMYNAENDIDIVIDGVGTLSNAFNQVLPSPYLFGAPPKPIRIGVLPAKIEQSRLIGCVVYPAAAVTAPGVIHHVEGDRFPIGELDGKVSERAKLIHDVLVKAGLKSRVLKDIRSEIWLKAWGNLSFNPISALTHATLVDICQFPETRHLAANMIGQAETIATKLCG